MRAPDPSEPRVARAGRPSLAALDGGRPERTAGAGGSLVMVHGPTLGRHWPIERLELLIGRDEGCDVVVALETVSRRHCIVSLDDGTVRVRDLGSTNGTFVDECPLKGDEEVPLASGNRLRTGSVIFKFLQGDSVETLHHEEIYRTMIVDGLTQAHNRRFLLEFLDRELARHQRHQRPLSLLLFDLDGFDRINDDWGQLTGDAVLRELAELVRARVRHEDCFARRGGEEFAVALSETDPEGARLFAERVRQLVEEHEFRANGERLPVTISVGVATAPPDLRDAEAFLAQADARLHEAKRQGRHRVAR
ncbi:MAG: GGDEF domain-containing protein [Deltaproteobacteria bacterium]|nr:GGDEF domain-containing protein [Deltaproteobacteria bacterium]